MPKEKLTLKNGAKAPGAKGAKAPGATAEPKGSAAAGDGTDAGESSGAESEASENNGDGDDDGETPDGEVEEPDGDDSANTDGTAGDELVPAGTDRECAEYRAAFGQTEGAILFCDGLSFEQACVKTIELKDATINSQATELAELKTLNKSLALQVHGTEEPVDTDDSAGEDSTEVTGAEHTSAGKAKFAASLKLPK